MNDLLAWAPLLAVGAVLWAGGHIGQVIHAANMDRREDHKEMMLVLEDIKHDIGNLDGNLDGLAQRYDPPDLSDYQ